MKDTLDILLELQNTPVPNLFVLGGFFFLFLSFVGKIGSIIELPKEREKWSAVIGTSFLAFGIFVYLLPALQEPAAPAPTPTPFPTNTDVIPTATETTESTVTPTLPTTPQLSATSTPTVTPTPKPGLGGGGGGGGARQVDLLPLYGTLAFLVLFSLALLFVRRR